MEFMAGSGGGGPAGSSSGGDPFEPSDRSKKKKRYHRHTAHQIQRLEMTFKECPHPDEKMRTQLSRELGLHPRQIKFWFQNRRTQMKAQHERADNCSLRAENDKIRCENIAIREALKNVICPSCGGPPVTEDSYFDEQKLRFENSQLREELDRVSSIAAKYIGRPISQLAPVQHLNISSLDLSMASYGGHGLHHGPSLDLDLIPGSSSTVVPTFALPEIIISDVDRPIMAEMAANAMDELIRLMQSNEPLWMRSSTDGREILNLETYDSVFPRSHSRNPNVRIEASRAASVMIMNSIALVDMFMDANKWVELFPTIVSRARTIDIVSSSGMLGNQNGTLQLMYEELQVLSALVPTRQFCFLRFCRQLEQGSWVIVDVSYDIPHQDSQFSSSSKVHRLPSGCLIQDMPNGHSKVTWVEHWEVEDRAPIDRLYRNLVHSGLAFGAERWISSLQRMSERFASLSGAENLNPELGGVFQSPEGKRSIMKLSQRMVNLFCTSITPGGQQWTTVSGLDEFEVRATLRRTTDPGQPKGVVLSAATTIWLPVTPENVFSFLRDERTRPQWDVLTNQNPVERITHIANGSHPGNSISILQASNAGQNNMLILQESCTDSSGSLVIYCPVDLPAINIAVSGEDPSYIPLLPSGFTISPDGQPDQAIGTSGGASTSSNSNRSSGSLITIVFQILVSNMPTARMTPESVNTVNELIGSTVRHIKAALLSPHGDATISLNMRIDEKNMRF